MVETMPPTVKPKRKGTFEKGTSGNPAGRPAVIRDLKAACRDLTGEGLAAVREALADPKRAVRAAQLLFAYGWGNPVSTVNVRTIRSMEDLTDEELRNLAGGAYTPFGDDDEPCGTLN